MAVAGDHAVAVVDPDLAAPKLVERLLVGSALGLDRGGDLLDVGEQQVAVGVVSAGHDAGIGGEDLGAALDDDAGVAEVEVDALADAVAVVAGGVRHERVLRGVAGTFDGHREAVEVVRIER